MKHETEPSVDHASPRAAGIQVEKLDTTPIRSFPLLFKALWESRAGLGAAPSLHPQNALEGGEGSPRLGIQSCSKEILWSFESGTGLHSTYILI